MEGLTPPRPLLPDDRFETFDCGRESLNQWFRRHAWHNQQSGTSRTNVVCDRSTGESAGFVSLCAAQIERSHLPKSAQRNRPDPIPALLLAQLAVDVRYQRRGIARSLMFFALTSAVRFSREIGCFCVITHPLDDGVRNFYRSFGFENLPFDPERSMAVRIADLEANGF